MRCYDGDTGVWLPIIVYLFTLESSYERPVCERRQSPGPVLFYVLSETTLTKDSVRRPVCERVMSFLEVKRKQHI